MPRQLGQFGLTLVAIAIAMGGAGCAGAAPPSFDPTGPCSADGSAPGAYPDLEGRLPTSYRDTAPGSVDSGRNCSSENLGLLAERHQEVRFAGATWSFGAERALVLVVFTAPGLEASEVADFYAASARAAQRTEVLAESEPSVSGRPARRLDTKTGERLQTVVVWPSADTDHVNVVISNDLPDERIADAVAAFGDR